MTEYIYASAICGIIFGSLLGTFGMSLKDELGRALCVVAIGIMLYNVPTIMFPEGATSHAILTE